MSEQRQIRVLHILPWVSSGGVERRRLSIVRHHASAEFEHKIFCLRSDEPLASEFLDNGVTVESMHDASWSELRVFRRLHQLIAEFQPDIIHGAVFEGVQMAVIAGKLFGVEHIVMEETSHATNRSWKGHALFGLYGYLADYCVAISPAVAEYVQEYSRIPRDKIITIPNGVPIPQPVPAEQRAATRQEYGIDDDCVLCITVGRLYDDSHKRVSDVLKAMRGLKEEGNNAHLLIVGDGPIQAELEALSRSLGVDDIVTFTGYQHHVDRLYGASDIFVLASGREGFGLVVAEAMMHALPTVTTTVGGIGNIVLDQTTGKTFDVGDVKALQNHIAYLAKHEELRQNLGKKGRKRAVKEFSSQRYADDVAKFYRMVMR